MQPATAIDAFTAHLAERDAAYRAQMDRQSGDAQLTKLQDMFDALSHAPLSDGSNGGKQVIASLMSSRHWRWLRVRSLMVARKCQLDLLPASGVLAKAATQRRTEALYRRGEVA